MFDLGDLIDLYKQKYLCEGEEAVARLIDVLNKINKEAKEL